MFLGRQNNKKIFVISFQRTGTTSTGQFFKDHGYNVADWHISRKNNWSIKKFSGEYSKIFNSKDFKANSVFEDGPWFSSDFYKYLFHSFPQSKFILIEREADKWFNSMLSHSKGKTIGNTHRHAVQYNREEDFYNLDNFEASLWNDSIDNLLELDESHRQHYISIYKNRNREVNNFFAHFDPSRLFSGRLEDKQLWQKMGRFFLMDVDENYTVHQNKSKQRN